MASEHHRTGGTATAAVPPALPVALTLGGTHADAVRRHVEGTLGWQPVDDSAAGLVPPALRIVDVAGGPAALATAGGPAAAVVPVVLLVIEADPADLAAEVARRLRPAHVLRWPQDRDRLVSAVAEVLVTGRQRQVRTRILRVGGASGGVGTSTIVLAIAGLLGWSGRRTLAAVRPGAPVGSVRPLPVEALGAVDLWGRASPLPGAGDARVVQVVGPGACSWPDDPGLSAAVLDEGVSTEVDVLVLRPDAAGLAAAGTTTAGSLVVVGSGPAAPRQVAAACGARHHVLLPRSARVARAGLHARVPTSLPGAFLRALVPLVPGDLAGVGRPG